MTTTLHQTAIVAHSPEKMFKIVDDIASYREFLPGCEQSTVLSREGETVIAELLLHKGPIKFSFMTCNHHKPYESIDMKLKEGAFLKALHGRWHFIPLPAGGTKITFDLSFELANKILTLTAGPILKQIAEIMVEAFINRASEG